jgi:hypothetical protein
VQACLAGLLVQRGEARHVLGSFHPPDSKNFQVYFLLM